MDRNGATQHWHDYIPYVYVITVETSKRRHNDMRRFLEQLSIPLEKVHFTMMPKLHMNGSFGQSCFDNHLQAMRHASTQLPVIPEYILILEDDTFIRDGTEQLVADKMTECLSWARNNVDSWDLIYLGDLPWSRSRKNPLTPNCLVPTSSMLTHAYLISRPYFTVLGAKSVSEWQTTMKNRAPHLFSWYHNLMLASKGNEVAIDDFYFLESYYFERKIFSIEPQLIYQSSTILGRDNVLNQCVQYWVNHYSPLLLLGMLFVFLLIVLMFLSVRRALFPPISTGQGSSVQRNVQ